MRDDEPLSFIEPEPADEGPGLSPWKVLVVDDDESVHDVTRFALRGLELEGRGLAFLHARSAAEARGLLRDHPDIAVALVDVVMEEDQAGLALVRHVREDLGNRILRIVLRTGQPGQAPEAEVVRDYDINDYKEKTELTSERLTTTLYTALRGYRDLMALEKSRVGLERVIGTSAELFKIRSIDQFATGLMEQLLSVLGLEDSSFVSRSIAFVADARPDAAEDTIVAAAGRYATHLHRRVGEVVDGATLEHIQRAHRERRTVYFDHGCVVYFTNRDQSSGIIYVAGCDDLDDTDRRLLELFSRDICIAFDNVTLNQELEDTQREIILTLGSVAEFRSMEVGHHLNRVAEYTCLLAEALGLPAAEVEKLRLAAPLHDIGKIAIPDQILLKPGPLTDDEFREVQRHCDIGHRILSRSRREVLQAAAIIAHQHQERWDGSGYPRGLKGEAIHLYGRLTAIADVFDALSTARCYKAAWPFPKVLEYIGGQRGGHFEPRLVDLFLAHEGAVRGIFEAYRDPEGMPPSAL
jgi:response regulator RpfG family c-di-GMP phosphodiesterase